MLTKRQKEILNFIKKYIKQHGFPPARREIADEFGFSSVNSVVCACPPGSGVNACPS